jgi:hypothetical protein
VLLSKVKNHLNFQMTKCYKRLGDGGGVLSLLTRIDEKKRAQIKITKAGNQTKERNIKTS